MSSYFISSYDPDDNGFWLYSKSSDGLIDINHLLQLEGFKKESIVHTNAHAYKITINEFRRTFSTGENDYVIELLKNKDREFLFYCNKQKTKLDCLEQLYSLLRLQEEFNYYFYKS